MIYEKKRCENIERGRYRSEKNLTKSVNTFHTFPVLFQFKVEQENAICAIYKKIYAHFEEHLFNSKLYYYVLRIE